MDRKKRRRKTVRGKYLFMKNASVLIFSALFIFSSNTAVAIPSFGTLMPERGGWLGGARADIIFNRDVKDYDGARSDAFYYRISYGFSKWFSFDGLIGMGQVRSEYQDEKKLRYPYNFSGGYGWRAKVYENGECGIHWVFGFQHVSTHPGKQWLQGKKHNIIWDEWQISTVISKRFGALDPYCGIKYSFIYLINKLDDDRHRRISTSPPIGLIVGTDLRINSYLYLNAEGRFFDETALNAGFIIKY